MTAATATATASITDNATAISVKHATASITDTATAISVKHATVVPVSEACSVILCYLPESSSPAHTHLRLQRDGDQHHMTLLSPSEVKQLCMARRQVVAGGAPATHHLLVLPSWPPTCSWP